MSIITEVFEYGKVWYPPTILLQTLDKVKHFEVREDDLIIVSYPRSGTHWMMELILLIQQDGNVENIKREEHQNREFTFVLPPDFNTCAVDLLVTCPSPRTYLPWSISSSSGLDKK
ncbi:Sulfotransferase 1C1 [Holothuria leucospilota]|uniref:Sulfotransferase 1C1 n=1 Tax=Holothuria leucospilota TaxID=206669 RepID=A0A9Q1BYU5_HOLLE|nr:Sulfotransferase 1C1 [Holothuria leucospilota]